MTNHTPTPWKLEGLPAVVVGPKGCILLEIVPCHLSGDINSVEQQRANAEIIVRAVNNHAQLLDALTLAIHRLESASFILKDTVPVESRLMQKAIQQARQALNQAKQ